MKALIAAACVAIIAFVGYYFWGEYQRGQALRAIAQQSFTSRDDRALPLYRLLKIEPGDEAGLREKCAANQRTLESFDLEGVTKDFSERASASCRQLGYL